MAEREIAGTINAIAGYALVVLGIAGVATGNAHVTSAAVVCVAGAILIAGERISRAIASRGGSDRADSP